LDLILGRLDKDIVLSRGGEESHWTRSHGDGVRGSSFKLLLDKSQGLVIEVATQAAEC